MVAHTHTVYVHTHNTQQTCTNAHTYTNTHGQTHTHIQPVAAVFMVIITKSNISIHESLQTNHPGDTTRRLGMPYGCLVWKLIVPPGSQPFS